MMANTSKQTVTIPGVNEPVTFAVAGNLEELRREVRGFNRLLWISLTALAAGLVLAIIVQVTIGLRPLRRVAEDVEHVRDRRKQALDPVGLREIDALVTQINTLIEQDRRMTERARANAADLAHSLKTPLALLRASLAPNDERLQQVQAIQRSIDWQLARAASAGPRPGVSAEIGATAESLAAGMRKLHAARSLQIDVDVPKGLRFAGDVEDLEEMLGNLLDNACKWTRQRVRLSAVARDRSVAIEVIDDGAGMSETQAALASERGRRFDESTEGSGLGLAIVRDVAAMYGGTLELKRSEWGGTKATLVLPSSPGSQLETPRAL